MALAFFNASALGSHELASILSIFTSLLMEPEEDSQNEIQIKTTLSTIKSYICALGVVFYFFYFFF